ncbi:hypothetical protein EBU95_05470 [bacterium]|nr:hypothetical protein [bacterium]
MKKLFFSVILLTAIATQIKAEGLFESAWSTITTTASNAKDAVKAVVYGTPETTAGTETMHMETTTKEMNHVMAKRSGKAYDQQHPEEATAAPKTTK